MASISKTQIANMALSHVGDRHNIENVETEVSTEADECRLWYDYSREQALQSYDWNFARARVQLTTHAAEIPTTANEPMAGVWAYRYIYPAGCLAVRKIQHPNAPPDDALPFEIELSPDKKTKTILTNMESAVCVYTFAQEEVSLYPPKFVLALSLALAVNICFTLSGKIKLKERLYRDFLDASASAAADSANEQVSPSPRDADWIRDRSGVSKAKQGGSWTAYPSGSN